jgi:hypothetical protein
MKLRYKLSDMGEVHHVLGMRVVKTVDGVIYVDQETYIRNKLVEFQMDECRPLVVPEVIEKRNEEGGELSGEDINKYRKIVGSLIYAATSTRPDISHAVHMLSRHMKEPKECDLVSAKRVLRYLKGAANMSLVYNNDGGGTTKVEAYTDSDLGGDKKDSKSTTGYCVYMNGNLVSWCAKKQDTVAVSTTEAEWMAACECMKEVIWLCELLSEIGIQVEKPATMFEDNQSTIKVCENDIMHDRSKHVRIKYHRIRQEIKDKTLRLEWVPSGDNVADIFTKSTGSIIFNKLRERLLKSNGSNGRT